MKALIASGRYEPVKPNDKLIEGLMKVGLTTMNSPLSNINWECDGEFI